MYGRQLYPLPNANGKYGDIWQENEDSNLSRWAIKQLKVKTREQDESSLYSELFHEYQIAQFLASHVPSFVAAPFAMMRGIIDGEAPSLVQQRIHGMTLNELQGRFFNLEPARSISTLQWCFLFLQFNEFLLRVGDSVAMRDVNLGNIIVQFRDKTCLTESILKFIDFGKWSLNHSDLSSSNHDTSALRSNYIQSRSALSFILSWMGFDGPSINSLYPTTTIITSSSLSAKKSASTSTSTTSNPRHDNEQFLSNLQNNFIIGVLQPFMNSSSSSDMLVNKLRNQCTIVLKLLSIRLVQQRMQVPLEIINERLVLDLD